MGSIKSVFVVLGAAVPVIYCGGLVYYFLSSSGSMDDAVTTGLGPTIVGLGAVGLLFAIPLLVKIVGAFSGAGSRARVKSSASETEEEFDADAVLARYKAKQSSAAPTFEANAPAAQRSTFGRRAT